MSDDPASLSKLHDIVVPEPVSWWPLAPAWWFVIAVVVLALGLIIFRQVRNYRAYAYRRAALRELAATEAPAAIATILRRTALAISSRQDVAALQGAQWLDWLAERAGSPVPDEVRQELSTALYQESESAAASAALRAFAEKWIRNHQAAC